MKCCKLCAGGTPGNLKCCKWYGSCMVFAASFTVEPRFLPPWNIFSSTVEPGFLPPWNQGFFHRGTFFFHRGTRVSSTVEPGFFRRGTWPLPPWTQGFFHRGSCPGRRGTHPGHQGTFAVRSGPGASAIVAQGFSHRGPQIPVAGEFFSKLIKRFEGNRPGGPRAIFQPF